MTCALVGPREPQATARPGTPLNMNTQRLDFDLVR